VRDDLPVGTVTFLFTDVEGSTRLLHELGASAYAEALGEHRRVLRRVFETHGGIEVDTQGDAFFVAFPTAPAAVSAAAEGLESLDAGRLRVRMGIHTGTPLLTEEGYVGVDVHRAARIAACGHGGQVLVSAATAALVNTAELLDLGEHRLKDLAAAERIYQLGTGNHAPLKTLYRTNLPIPATPFLGRQEELNEVLGLLRSQGRRLLTLTGPGGTGKTRLALQAAAESSDDFPDGIYWVPLAPLNDAALVLEATAQSVGAQDGLAEHLADKRLLILLDNFEHVVEAAGDLTRLLSSCPNLRLLITSRELLRVPGEHAYAVPPLKAKDGTDLFLARARAADPGFASGGAVRELCARLENLPLALELAAARIRILSPEQLLERLSQRLDLLSAGRGVDPRQQTLRATIEWSYELLNQNEKTLFARLSVFAGGCTLEAAEEVCRADLDDLQSLVDKSLVRFRERTRFWMLETIREYALERLQESGDYDVLLRRHAEYFLKLAHEAEPHLLGSPGDWLKRLEAEHNNFRAAFEAFEASRETQLTLELAGALIRFWYIRGHLTEGRRRLESALHSDERPTSARAKAANAAAVAAVNTRDTAGARGWAQHALELHQELGDQWDTAYSIYLLGTAAGEEGDFETARELFEDSLRRFRESRDDHYTLVATDALAWVVGSLGDGARRRALHEENLRQARAQSNQRILSLTLDQLAVIAREEGRHDEAVSMLQESLRILRDFGDRGAIAQSLGRLSETLAAAGRMATAARLLSASEVLRIEVGGGFPWLGDANEQTLAVIHTQLDEAVFNEAWRDGETLTVDGAIALAGES
jgi:predicted ATPase/class 3 adenylate cyclase